MQSYSLKFKIAIFVSFFSVLPIISFAYEGGEQVPTVKSEATTTKMSIELARKEEKKADIKRQLDDIIEISSALINKIQNIAKRVAEREEVMLALDNIRDEAREKIDLKQKKLEETLQSANDRATKTLPKLAEAILNIDKPAKLVKDFRKEIKRFKTDITSAHKLVLEIIYLIKKESIKAEADESATTTIQTSTTTDQESN